MKFGGEQPGRRKENRRFISVALRYLDDTPLAGTADVFPLRALYDRA